MNKAEERARNFKKSLDYYEWVSIAPEYAYKLGYEKAIEDLSLIPEDIVVILNLAREHSPEETAKIFNDSR